MNFLKSWFDKRSKYVVLARRYLEKQNLVILQDSFVNRPREFDLLALDRRTLVVVAVRLRGCPDPIPDDEDLATASDVEEVATEWRSRHPEVPVDAVRMDVLRLDWYAGRRSEPVLRYFPDAVFVGQSRRLVESSSP
jgi:Holliday junction resolvase-like predicted endonuclease